MKRPLAHSLLLFAIALLTTVSGRAELDGPLAPAPLCVGFTKNVNQATMMAYVSRLVEELQVGKSIWGELENEEIKSRIKETTPQVERPVNGLAVYMVQSLIPSFTNVYFSEVLDEADARRVINGQKSMMGSNATVESPSAGNYLFVNKNSWDQPIPSGKDPDEYLEAQRASLGPQSGTYRNTVELVDRDGTPMIERTWSMTTYYRYHDRLLFSAEFDDLWEMDLPTRDSLVASARGENDLGFDAFFDRIPAAIKTLGWNMLSSTAGVQMQRRDEEVQDLADLRRTSMQFGLNLTKAVLFDVDEANGWVKWADEEVQTVRAGADISARRNGSFSQQLEEVSSAASRFGPILQDGAPGTLHGCLRIFEEDDPMLNAAARWLVQEVSRSAGGDQVLTDAATDLSATLQAIAEHRTLEFFVKAGWTAETNGVIYCGVQVDDNPGLLDAVYAFLQNSGEVASIPLQMDEYGGQRAIHLQLPDDAQQQIEKLSGLKLSHIYIAHANSCLWLAAGDETAHEMIWQSVDRCAGRAVASRTPLLSASLDAEAWLALPQDDPVGVASLLTWLDANVAAFPLSPVSFSFGMDSDTKPTALLQRCLDYGGDRQASFSVVADRGGLRISATMGEALGNYYVARMIDLQDRQMQRMRDRANVDAAESEVTKEVQASP